MARFGDDVWRACLVGLQSSNDAQDAFQDTFMKYALADTTEFADEDHRKAWLIKVAVNRCRDMQRAARRHASPTDDETTLDRPSRDPASQPDSRIREVLDAMNALDDPPRTPVYLALYAGFSAPEIAEMVSAPVNTVYSWISRGRKRLMEALR